MAKKTGGFKPMLADAIEPDKYPLRFPLFVSPKLDGVRCVVRDGVAYSRSLKPIPNQFVQFVLGRDDPFGMPAWLQFASPLAAVAIVASSLLVWRTGVRHYTSTGS